jgi:hypothetical protein
MTTFPTPNPALTPAENPRSTAHINDSPSTGQVNGKPPVDAPPTVERMPMPGQPTGAPGLAPDPSKT